MKYKVIFDTNLIINKKISSFFGNQDELIKFQKEADIIIPEIVIEELEHRYVSSFNQEKEKFQNTLLANIIENNIDKISKIGIKKIIKDLLEKETISYETIKLTDFSILPKMKKMALEKKPPFEDKEKTDKGFKDAYIYFTILEYLKNVPYKYIFFCTKDERLKDAFKNFININVISSYKEFFNTTILQFQDKYFLSKLKEKLGFKVEKDQVKKLWLNDKPNEVISIETKNEKFVVEIDAREIINYANANKYRPLIKELINSYNFNSTHNNIYELKSYISLFSPDEITEILEAFFTNEQIQWIIKDADVKEFIGSLYKANTNSLEKDTTEFLEELFK